MAQQTTLKGNIVDVVSQRIFKGIITFSEGKIVNVKEEDVKEDHFILPGLVDAHIHIESSMLVPSEFAKIAVNHGTVATVSDPHEIANVLGMKGVDFMIENSNTVPFKFYFGAPSCVPATPFESSGASIEASEIKQLLSRSEIKYLSEMMNFPGVVHQDAGVVAKLEVAHELGKPVDGHAPGLTGIDLEKYVEAGIITDHECFTLEEARQKMALGMKVQIREGSAARNFDTLLPLLDENPEMIMFCSDDKHPDDLIDGHINLLIKKAISRGYDPIKIIRACTYNPKTHYNLENGLLQIGDEADIVVVDDLSDFNIEMVFIHGELVSENGKSLIKTAPFAKPNVFNALLPTTLDLKVKAEGKNLRVIEALEGQLITKSSLEEPLVSDKHIIPDTERDILKMVVINRYQQSKPAVAFIRGFGLKNAALASTVAHDSHNIIAVGTSDEAIVEAIGLIAETKGGIAIVNNDKKLQLPLPVGGIMSDLEGKKVAELYEEINSEALQAGSAMKAPFMTLSFMALLVIPELKLSDKGLFDGQRFTFTSLFDI